MDLYTVLVNNQKSLPEDLVERIKTTKARSYRPSFSISQYNVQFDFYISQNISHLDISLQVYPIRNGTFNKLEFVVEKKLTNKLSEIVGQSALLNHLAISDFGYNKSINSLRLAHLKRISITNSRIDILDIDNVADVYIEGVKFRRASFKDARKNRLIDCKPLKENGQIKFVDLYSLRANQVFNYDLLFENDFNEVFIEECKLDSVEVNNVDFVQLIINESSIKSLVLGQARYSSMIQAGLYDNFKVVKKKNKQSEFVVANTSVHDIVLRELHIAERRLFWGNALRQNHPHGIKFTINDALFDPEIKEISNTTWEFNGIVQSKYYPEGSRKFINNIKNYYSNQQNVMKSQLFNAFEKKWYFDQNKRSIPLFVSWLSNSFGLSLGLPLFWIVFFVLLQTFVLLQLAGTCEFYLSESWGLFFNILNPAHRTNLFLDVFDGNCTAPLNYKNWLYVIDNLNRIFIGYMIFQFANAFRYRYKLR